MDGTKKQVKFETKVQMSHYNELLRAYKTKDKATINAVEDKLHGIDPDWESKLIPDHKARLNRERARVKKKEQLPSPSRSAGTKEQAEETEKMKNFREEESQQHQCANLQEHTAECKLAENKEIRDIDAARLNFWQKVVEQCSTQFISADKILPMIECCLYCLVGCTTTTETDNRIELIKLLTEVVRNSADLKLDPDSTTPLISLLIEHLSSTWGTANQEAQKGLAKSLCQLLHLACSNLLDISKQETAEHANQETGNSRLIQHDFNHKVATTILDAEFSFHSDNTWQDIIGPNVKVMTQLMLSESPSAKQKELGIKLPMHLTVKTDLLEEQDGHTLEDDDEECLQELVESAVFSIGAQYFPHEIAPFASQIIMHFQDATEPEYWITSMKSLYNATSARDEIIKHIPTFIQMIQVHSGKRIEFTEALLELLLEIASENPKLFSSGKNRIIIEVCEEIMSTNPEVGTIAIQILEALSHMPELLRGRGKWYYEAARRFETFYALVISNILMNISMIDEREAERILEIMESEMLGQGHNIIFVEDALKTWKKIATVYPRAVKKRKSVVEKYKADPILRNPAVKVLQVIKQQSRICSIQ